MGYYTPTKSLRTTLIDIVKPLKKGIEPRFGSNPLELSETILGQKLSMKGKWQNIIYRKELLCQNHKTKLSLNISKKVKL